MGRRAADRRRRCPIGVGTAFPGFPPLADLLAVMVRRRTTVECSRDRWCEPGESLGRRGRWPANRRRLGGPRSGVFPRSCLY
jgi:hypothetical protein